MTGWAYRTSAAIARDVTGPFAAYTDNEQPFLGVMKKHRYYTERIEANYIPEDLMSAARSAWDEAINLGSEHGFRNAQASVLAPTGTIGFMMDCDTTGIEPDIALIKYKRLVGGGTIKIVNNTTEEALERLGYDEDQRKAIVEYIDREETIEGAPGLLADHLPVFDCAFRAANGTRSIHYMGHIRMMSAAQPFISGAISKTVNQPADATVEDVENAYMEAWKAGLKAIAVYREGCKRTQPVSTSKTDPGLARVQAAAAARTLVRRKLPDERKSLTHKFSVGGHEGYIHVGLYDEGEPGEIFIRMAKEGSTISGLMDSFATAVSLALQHGVPLRLLVDKFSRMRFEPSGFTGNPEIPRATSVMDYLFRWLGAKFLRPETEAEGMEEAKPAEATAAAPGGASPVVVIDQTVQTGQTASKPSMYGFLVRTDAPTCPECGSIMVPNGSCHKCTNCGTTSGCS
jgi:ribonucleoside-diphosphate reductase alpha chain